MRLRARPRNFSPASVSATLRVERSNSRAPTVCSSWVTRLAATEGTTFSCRAASEKLPYRATATKARRLATMSMIYLKTRKLRS